MHSQAIIEFANAIIGKQSQFKAPKPGELQTDGYLHQHASDDGTPPA